MSLPSPSPSAATMPRPSSPSSSTSTSGSTSLSEARKGGPRMREPLSEWCVSETDADMDDESDRRWCWSLYLCKWPMRYRRCEPAIFMGEEETGDEGESACGPMSLPLLPMCPLSSRGG